MVRALAKKIRNAYFSYSKPPITKTIQNFQGTGIELATVKSLLKMMNRDISLTSEQGKGATFTIRIPNA